jgi:predicted transcriptional regulator
LFSFIISWEKGVPNSSTDDAIRGSLLIQVEKSVSNHHRGNLDIIAAILDASHGGAKKTFLMYRCNLSFKQMKSYSYFLLNNGLLRLIFQAAESDIALFEITDKGKEFLREYKGLKALVKQ